MVVRRARRRGRPFDSSERISAVVPLAIMTLALVTGDGNSCTVLRYTPRLYALPKAIVGCAGQYCLSCNRPLLPGAPMFDYRTDFNYPWSQVPCAPVAPALFPPSPFPEIVPNGQLPEEIPAPEAVQASSKRRPTSSVVAARRANVRIVEKSERSRSTRPSRAIAIDRSRESVLQNAP
jgi:hypothetical protein